MPNDQVPGDPLLYATLRTIHLSPEQRAAFIAVWEQRAAPHLRTFPGCQAVYLLTAPDSDSVVLVSLWQSETAMQAWQSNAAHQQAHAHLAALRVTPPPLAGYDVRLHVHPARDLSKESA